MTCIVGLQTSDGVWLGADSAGVSGLDICRRHDPKVFQVNAFLVGFTESFRMGQILRFKFSPPEQKPSQSDYQYMCTDVIDAIRECFKENGFAKKDDEQESGGEFIIAYRGQLYKIYEDYQVEMPGLPYLACGCGEGFALGALFASAAEEPEVRVRQALEAAQEHSAGVRAPFHIVKLTASEAEG